MCKAIQLFIKALKIPHCISERKKLERNFPFQLLPFLAKLL
jgi:hypothetical protein